VPAGPDWLHEIKYDGYPLRLERDGDRVREPQVPSALATPSCAAAACFARHETNSTE
jgi:hypothetical protein